MSDKVFNGKGTANAAMTTLYAGMVNDNMTRDIPLLTGLYTDEFKHFTSILLYNGMYSNSLAGQVTVPSTVWNNGYKYIYQANTVMEEVEKSANLDIGTKSQLIAESKFIRAYWYFYLANLYGDVPLALNTDYRVNAKLPREQKSEVYDQIILDLEEVKSVLGDRYVDGLGTPGSIERIRPNKYTAIALLSRVHLYSRDYQKALDCANQIIQQKELYDTVALDDVFLKNSKENIWQLPPTSSSPFFNTREGFSFIIVSTTRQFALNESILTAFEEGDLRKTKWIGVFQNAQTEKNDYYPFKYKKRDGASITEYSSVFRIAEQYLIRAEAKANLNDFEGARTDLNVIRKRAGLSPVDYNTLEDLSGGILRERRVELFSEWGHRWFDIQRSNKVHEIMASIAESKGGTWAEYKVFWPIEQLEIDKNQNLKQTIGYQ